MLLNKGGPHGQLTEDKVVKGINEWGQYTGYRFKQSQAACFNSTSIYITIVNIEYS